MYQIKYVDNNAIARTQGLIITLIGPILQDELIATMKVQK